MTLKKITNATKCQPPCSYTEFSLAEDPFSSVEFNPKLGVDLIFGRGIVAVAKEELIYPFTSFIAEVGGCLGLFLGFSFLMGLDLLKESFIRLKKQFE